MVSDSRFGYVGRDSKNKKHTEYAERWLGVRAPSTGVVMVVVSIVRGGK